VERPANLGKPTDELAGGWRGQEEHEGVFQAQEMQWEEEEVHSLQ